MLIVMVMVINEYKCPNLELSVDAHIHYDACEYVYLTKLDVVFALSDEVLIRYFNEYGSFEVNDFLCKERLSNHQNYQNLISKVI